ncbi:MAG TPA: cytochrome C oxidase subunit I [Burkholderiales bacterium]|nr:cytochrome C oxidase subunit I [Burkholderiales bacterium]
MLLLLGAISLAPFAGSLLLYYFWEPQTFTNYGELIAVEPLAGVTIPVRSGKPFRIDDLRGNWVFLMADAGDCNDYCQSKLYVMRQIRLTQGKDRERIERIWLIPDGVRPLPVIEAEYQGTRTILPASDDFLARLPASESPRDHIYVIDPFGNLMMRFPRNVDPQRMKKDINKLMKVSGGWIQTGK